MIDSDRFVKFLDRPRILEQVPEDDDKQEESEGEEDPGGPVHQQHLVPAHQQGYYQHLLPAPQQSYYQHLLPAPQQCYYTMKV